MGVRFLQTYLEKRLKAQRVSIKELIEKFKYERGNTIDEVVIVVDSSSSIRLLYHDDWLLGGEIKLFRETAKRFVDTFAGLGVRLVFYCDGPWEDRKLRLWFEDQGDKLDYWQQLFDQLHREQRPVIDKYKCPVWLNYMARYIFISLGCEVRTTKQKGDEEIAEYARTNRCCLGILAQDTDFVIMLGAEYYFSTKDLIWTEEDVTTLIYDRWALARHLGIPAAQLPLLATLCGNKKGVTSEELQEFHDSVLRNQNRYFLFEDLAQFIRQKWLCNEAENWVSIATCVFGRDSSGRAEQLRRSVESYGPQSLGVLGSAGNRPSPIPKEPAEAEGGGDGDHATDANWLNILIKARHLRDGGTDTIYKLLKGCAVKQSGSLEDYWSTDLPLTPALFQPLRERIYGILLQEKPGGPGTVEEWFITDVVPGRPARRTPVLPPRDLHPGLLSLWDGVKDHETETTRWKLFSHSVSPNLSHRLLRRLTEEGSPHLVVPTALLFYLREAIPRNTTDESSQYLLDWELEALLIQAALMKTSTNPSRLVVPSPYDVRAIRLATIFSRGFMQMMTTCGCPIPLAEAMPWLYFDGKLFHKTYLGLKNNQYPEELCINQDGESVMNDFQRMRDIILGSA